MQVFKTTLLLKLVVVVIEIKFIFKLVAIGIYEIGVFVIDFEA